MLFRSQSINERHLLIAHEPESAALYCINLPSEQRLNMNNLGGKGDKFVVIDLGGGTVDILAIEVLEDGNLREICPGQGDRVGGQDVNNAFFQACKDVLKGDAWHSLGNNNVEDMLVMEMDFENQKVRIGSSNPEDEEIRVKLPSSAQDMLKKGTITIKPDSLKSKYFRIEKGDLKFKSELVRNILFDETVKLILSSIQKILQNKELQDLKTIVLVGGFAESKIVVGKIRDMLADHYADVKVVVPTSPFRAVLMGAVLFGHDPLIFQSRICRATYGVDIYVPFDENMHDKKKMWRNEIENTYHCKDIFSIHVRKGQSVKLRERQAGVEYNPIYKSQTKMDIEVFSSINRNPKYTTDDGCQKIGQFSVDIPNTDKGTKRKVKIEMIYGGTEIAVIATDEETKREISSTFRLPD